jgi:hypothetical protein
MNEQSTPTLRSTKMPTETVIDPTGVTELPQQSKRIRKQVQKYVPSMKGKSYEYTATQIYATEFEPQIIEMVLSQLTLKAAIKLSWQMSDVGMSARPPK